MFSNFSFFSRDNKKPEDKKEIVEDNKTSKESNKAAEESNKAIQDLQNTAYSISV